MLKGSIKLNDNTISGKDAIGIFDADEFSFQTESESEFIIIDVPMK